MDAEHWGELQSQGTVAFVFCAQFCCDLPEIPTVNALQSQQGRSCAWQPSLNQHAAGGLPAHPAVSRSHGKRALGSTSPPHVRSRDQPGLPDHNSGSRGATAVPGASPASWGRNTCRDQARLVMGWTDGHPIRDQSLNPPWLTPRGQCAGSGPGRRPAPCGGSGAPLFTGPVSVQLPAAPAHQGSPAPLPDPALSFCFSGSRVGDEGEAAGTPAARRTHAPFPLPGSGDEPAQWPRAPHFGGGLGVSGGSGVS